VRYDAAILGAGPDGLAAAARLARAGLKIIVIERAVQPGGLCLTREFHPGFRASPFADELPSIPVGIFWSLDLARRGAIFAPPLRDAIMTDGGIAVADASIFASVLERAQVRISDELNHWDLESERVPTRRNRILRWLTPPRRPPLDEWSRSSLMDVLRDGSPLEIAALVARVLTGKAVDPYLRGTALHLLAPGLSGSGVVAGGLGALGEALNAAAREAGAEISCGLEATGILRAKERIRAVTLADGTQIETGAVLSTLDPKRTILSLFSWSDLPKATVNRAAQYRMAGGTARVLVALDAIPGALGLTEAVGRAVVHTARSAEEHAAAHASWRAHVVPEQPPASVRIVSAADPRLAPHGKASVTVTLSGIPGRLFDGSWTGERREALRQKALVLMDSVLPGSGEHVLASELLVPPDIEEALGVTGGDLAGGEIAADQMFANRAGAEWPRTPIDGLYLAGPSSPVGPGATAAAGWIAAKALIADHRAGRLK
jgi:phytoene dehydrogenase-like protein